ncbi:MAG TPA: TonB-dependent receptor [Vicinamibacterales bacterium]|nr:TonB-dependent receptor [Vicinamibacterales bacterium]
MGWTTSSRRLAAGLVLIVLNSSFAFARIAGPSQERPGTPPPTGQPGTQTTGQTPPKPTPTPTPKPDDPQKAAKKEEVVVSASKTEQLLVDAPATMTVIGERALTVAPSNNYAELLRAVPGVNITQISARDVNVNTRGATSSLATSQLTVVDGRSVYLDFFGFTMWEFVPADTNEIKRIEVIRGPASAVWGANALNGVVNILTKSPREMVGHTMTFGVGSFDASVNHNGVNNGTLFYARGTAAQAVNDRWSYKVAAGYYDSDPLARPTGVIPNGGTTSYPPYTNTGTTQPRFDGRVDYDFADGISKLEMSGGYGGTDGMMHTGIGPFNIDQGANMSFWKATYTRKAFRLQSFMNILDGEATNVVALTPTGAPLGLTFAPKTFDVEVGDTRLIGSRMALTYGGNIRANRFHLSIAPGETSRNEGGAYVQDEFMLGKYTRVIAGVRVDKFSNIEDVVASPRVAVVLKPSADQSIRISYNRAFRAPSMVNNNLDTVIATPIPLAQINPAYGNAIYLLPTAAVGNPNLTEESNDAYEVAYTGHVLPRTLLSVAGFYTEYKNGIYFQPSEIWLTPPPGFPGLGPVPPGAIWAGLLANGVVFPKTYTYNNLGTVVSKGVEVGVDHEFTNQIFGFANYTFQADPVPSFPGLTEEQALKEINIPSRHQFNVGLSFITDRAFGTINVTHASEAFWQDVLDERYHGFTQPYTSVNVSAGYKMRDGRYSLSIKVTNLGNQQIQQHIFGDIIKRSVVGEFKVFLR